MKELKRVRIERMRKSAQLTCKTRGRCERQKKLRKSNRRPLIKLRILKNAKLPKLYTMQSRDTRLGLSIITTKKMDLPNKFNKTSEQTTRKWELAVQRHHIKPRMPQKTRSFQLDRRKKKRRRQRSQLSQLKWRRKKNIIKTLSGNKHQLQRSQHRMLSWMLQL